MRLRLLVSATIGLASGSFCWLFLSHFHQGAADFSWAIQAARDLLAHKNPYDNTQQLYPLTVSIFGLPFVWTKPDLAAGIFYGISSALLAFGLTRQGYHRLLIFLAYPYWAGILTAQWPPLIMAASFFPLLLPAVMAKPQLGVPVALTSLTRRGVIATALLLLFSLLLMPRWPTYWLANTHHYDRFIPLLILPGPLLLLALFRYRDRDSRLLLLMAIMPQRWFYDAFILWLIPKTRREIVWTVFLSWIPGIWRWYHVPHSFTEVGRWMVVFMYFPIMFTILWGRFTKNRGF
ncbi:MAG TPA: hypothetical protein VFA74_11520 [Terriglobales bacterium]|nr:hypothetical protein [Terriglobales bacterium]